MIKISKQSIEKCAAVDVGARREEGSQMDLTIDILYTVDCTGWQQADENLRQALADLGYKASINYWLIESDHQAHEALFIGSPTIRVNGYDLFPVEGASAAMRLRPYFTPEGMLDYPTYDMLVAALPELIEQLGGNG